MNACSNHGGDVAVVYTCHRCPLCDSELRVRVLEQENNDLQEQIYSLQDDLENYKVLDDVIEETNRVVDETVEAENGLDT